MVARQEAILGPPVALFSLNPESSSGPSLAACLPSALTTTPPAPLCLISGNH